MADLASILRGTYGQGYTPPALMPDTEQAQATTRDVMARMLRDKEYQASPFGRFAALIESARGAMPAAPEGLPPVGRNVARVGDFFADMLAEGAQTANRWLGAPQFPERVEAGDTLAPLGMAAMGAPFAVRGAVGSAGGRLNEGIRAYHGSPHDFDRFDMSKIGTGEGAQAYGHGLYFAEKEGTAKAYRDALADRHFKSNEGSVPFGEAFTALEDAAVARGLHRDQANQLARQIADKIERGAPLDDIEYPVKKFNDAYYAMVEEAQTRGFAPNTGRMYEVNIRANPDEFLDWDAPLSKQSENVRGAVDKLMSLFPADQQYDLSKMTADDVLGMAGRGRAEEALREYGVSGIRYLDQGSRGPAVIYNVGAPRQDFGPYSPYTTRADAEKQVELLRRHGFDDAEIKEQIQPQSRNFVLFRDDIIDIVKKYGIAAAVSTYGLDAVQGVLAEQDGQGSMSSMLRDGQ